MAYLTVDDLRENYGFRFTNANQDLVNKALESAEDLCLRYIGLEDGLSAEQTDYFDGTSTILVLDNAPVLSVSAVYSDRERSYSEALDTSDYRVDLRSGVLYLYITPASARDAVRVDYTAGYTEIPAPVALAIAMTAQKILSDLQGSSVGVLSRTLEGGSETLDNNLPTLAVKQVLDGFRLRRAR